MKHFSQHTAATLASSYQKHFPAFGLQYKQKKMQVMWKEKTAVKQNVGPTNVSENINK